MDREKANDQLEKIAGAQRPNQTASLKANFVILSLVLVSISSATSAAQAAGAGDSEDKKGQVVSPKTCLVQEQAEQNTRAVAQCVEEKLWPAFGDFQQTYEGLAPFGGDDVFLSPTLGAIILGGNLGALYLITIGIFRAYRLVSLTWKSVEARAQSRYTTLKDG